MPFDPVDPKQSFPTLERVILEKWRREDTFHQSLKRRRGGTVFRFYDGPPFATGLPHYGHLLAGTIKDVIPRYQTMRGSYVERRFGWDCHGLPVEYEIEKEHGIQGKKDIETMGIAQFNALCRTAVQRYTKEWRTTVERMGRWVDMDWDYRTMDPDYMESLWWVFKELWGKKLIEEGHKPMHICPRCVTPLSNFEVTQGYKEVTDVGVVVKFALGPPPPGPLPRRPGEGGFPSPPEGGGARGGGIHTYLLAWTTTPWTLPGNLFLAVKPRVQYVRVAVRHTPHPSPLPMGEGNTAHYIVAKKCVERIFTEKEYEIIGTPFTSQELVGRKYTPLFPYFSACHSERSRTRHAENSTIPHFDYAQCDTAFHIVTADFVTTDEGTGIVHIAPGFGEDDYRVWKRECRTSTTFSVTPPLLQHVTMEGRFTDDVTDFAGLEVKPAGDPMKTDRKIVEELEKKDLVFSKETVRHSYPHCWRCDTPLLNYATSSWFVKVEKIKEDLLTATKETEWVPGHLRDGRFGKWLEGARDWAISRQRYWGTPLPIWRAQTCHPERSRRATHGSTTLTMTHSQHIQNDTNDLVVIGSRDDLMAHCPTRFTKVTVLRHGESDGNIQNIYQGEPPGTGLTEEGKRQARTTGDALRSSPIAAIYTSPLRRTHETAKIIAAITGTTVIVDDRLRESRFGPYEGKPIGPDERTFLRTVRRNPLLDPTNPDHRAQAGGMELWAQVQQRIHAFLMDILPRHRGDHIVIVSHADPIRNLIHSFTKEDPLQIGRQPFPAYAHPRTFFWDHETRAQLDLHRETVDSITWNDRDGRTFRRVPDVLDCWFESGAMPYAEQHFPFAPTPNPSPVNGRGEHSFSLSPPKGGKGQGIGGPSGFPADFIAEGLDQTRGWFYTLMVLSVALFRRPAFRHCIVNGIVLAQDGKKMSKRLKNYPDPLELAEKYGADAIRFTMMHSPAVHAEELRFSTSLVEETVRSVLLPLWNAYSFFVTYANLAHFEPLPSPSSSDHPLDRWIRVEIQDLTNRMTEELDRYDLSRACEEISDTIDSITNWYIRLSRRRFAGKDPEDSASAALATLYDVLRTLMRLLAPFCPFITEAITQNLVPGVGNSVHCTDWPNPRPLTPEEDALLRKNRVLRRIVSLGLRARAEARLKLRQPLASAHIAVPPILLPLANITQEDALLIERELNVETISLLSDPGMLGERIALVDARKAGPRLGARVQDVINAGKRGEFEERDDGSFRILDELLLPEEAQIIYRGRDGEHVQGEGGIVVSVDTHVTDALRQKGLARDLIRAIQRLRKEAGLNISDRIVLHIDGADDVLRTHKDLIERETLATMGKSDGPVHEVDVNGRSIVLRFHHS